MPTSGFPCKIRLLSNTNKFSIPAPRGGYRPFKALQGRRGENVCVDGNAKKRSSAASLAKRCEAQLYRRKKRAQEVTQSCVTVGVANIPHIASGSDRGGIGRTKNKITRKTDHPVPQLSGPITQTTA